MALAADRHGLRLFVHHNTRFYPDSRHVLDVVRDGLELLSHAEDLWKGRHGA